MLADFPLWLGDLHQVLPPQFVGPVVTIVSVICGAVVGAERQRREKPAGLRTLMLVCLGSCVFTQAGILVAKGVSDPARIAAQVVTGVGFLGAGAIIRERGMVIGVTTGAAIWAVAAIGVIVGVGYVAAGAFFTFLAVGTLTAERHLERLFYGACRFTSVRVEYDRNEGRTRPQIQAILDEFQIGDDAVSYSEGTNTRGAVTIRYCHFHRSHRNFLSALACLPGVQALREQD